MKIRALLSLLLAGIFSTSALAGLEPPKGEKLITFQPDPDAWEIADKDLINSKRLVWFNKEMRAQGRTYDDFYEISIFNKPKKKDLDGVREWSDKKGSLKCRQFQSTNLGRDTNSSYPSVFWRTTCLKSNAPIAQLITKLIEGERHLYQVQKAWVGEADEEAINIWQKRIEEAYVCNIDSESNPCPTQSEAPVTEETPDEAPVATANNATKE